MLCLYVANIVQSVQILAITTGPTVSSTVMERRYLTFHLRRGGDATDWQIRLSTADEFMGQEDEVNRTLALPIVRGTIHVNETYPTLIEVSTSLVVYSFTSYYPGLLLPKKVLVDRPN